MQLNDKDKQKLIEITKDFYRFCENNLWIKTKDAKKVRFVPNFAQRILIDYVIKCLHEGKPIRLIVLKARQMGFSTVIEAIIYWWTTTHQNTRATIIAHEDDASKNIYNMFRTYYDNSHPFFKPTRKYNTKSDLVFSKEVDGEQLGLDSVISTMTAANKEAGRSSTVQLVHGSEVGMWEHGSEIVSSLLQAVPLLPNTMIFLESTAKGRGNFFHTTWVAAVKGESAFNYLFFPWWLHDEYELDGEPGDYDAEEEELIGIMKAGCNILGKNYTVTDEDSIKRKIMYRRYKKSEFVHKEEEFFQEYPATAEEAFIASGRSRFSKVAIRNMEKIAESKPDADKYNLRQNENRDVFLDKIEDKESAKYAPLKVWELPVHGAEYVIGADVAEGLDRGDYSVADIIRIDDMEKNGIRTVARYRGHCDPDQFGAILDQIGRAYNFARMGVEINNHGLTTVQRLRNLFYPNLYMREKGIDEVFEESTSKYGWKTTQITKPMAIDYLAEAIREGNIKDEDMVFISEAYSYVIDDRGRTNAEVGSHDDTIMAKAIALQMFDWSENSKRDIMIYKPIRKKY